MSWGGDQSARRQHGNLLIEQGHIGRSRGLLRHYCYAVSQCARVDGQNWVSGLFLTQDITVHRFSWGMKIAYCCHYQQLPSFAYGLVNVLNVVDFGHFERFM